MASHDRREFDKYLKFLTYKVTQVVVQSRQGRKIRTKSAPHGTEWFNVTIQDDKQVSSELKHSLEGRLPQQDSPVCVEISMETLEGETLVLEVWSISMNYSTRDISVSVPHLLYPRLSLMLKSLIAISRTTPAYRLARQQEDAIKFNYRVYTGSSDEDTTSRDFNHICFAKTSCPYGTMSVSLSYRPTIAFPDRVPRQKEMEEMETEHPDGNITSGESLSQRNLPFPFAPGNSSQDSTPSMQPFAAILHPRLADAAQFASTTSTSRQDSGNSHNSDVSPDPPKETDGFIMVNIGEIKPSFAQDSGVDVCDFLQSSRDFPDLDLFSSEQSTDVLTAMKIIDENLS